jgi:predicted acetyltransferase
MHFRPATRDDITALATLWAHAFPGERSVPERVRQLQTGGAYGDLDDILLSEEDGRLIAACKLYRMTQHLAGAALPMMGLAAVAVAAQARRRGAGAELCRTALRHARDRGDVASMLYPFRPAYYRAFGWALAGELHRYRFRPESLVADNFAPLRLADSDDVAGIAACYASFARASHGLIDRAPSAWKLHLGQPDTHAFVLDDGGIQGYLIAHYRAGSSRERRVFEIRELVASTAADYAGILGWIRAQRDLWRLVQYDAAPDEHFALRLSEPRPPGFRHARELWDPVARIIRGPMLRVLNVQEAIRRRRDWNGQDEASFTVEVLDRELPENDGPWRVAISGGTAEVEHAGRRTTGPRLSTDAAGFAQIYAGELPVRDAVRLGTASVTGDIAVLDRAFRPPSAFRLYDEF